MNDRLRRTLRLAAGRAAALMLMFLPAPAVLAYTAHYLVVTENGNTGELAVVHHQLVELSGSPEGTPTRPRRSALESRLQARVLDKVTGDTRFQTMVTGSPWLRGEFRGANSIDGRIVPVPERQYVVRVPAGASALLELQGLDADTVSSAANASGKGPRLVIDLDQAKPITGPIAPAQKAIPSGVITTTVPNRPEAKIDSAPACSTSPFPQPERQ